MGDALELSTIANLIWIGRSSITDCNRRAHRVACFRNTGATCEGIFGITSIFAFGSPAAGDHGTGSVGAEAGVIIGADRGIGRSGASAYGRANAGSVLCSADILQIRVIASHGAPLARRWREIPG